MFSFKKRWLFENLEIGNSKFGRIIILLLASVTTLP